MSFYKSNQKHQTTTATHAACLSKKNTRSIAASGISGALAVMVGIAFYVLNSVSEEVYKGMYNIPY